MKTEKEDLLRNYKRIKKDRETLEILVRKSEVQNEKYMREYCMDKKKHLELVLKKTKDAQLEDQMEPHELMFTVARQQNQLERMQIQNEVL